MNIRVPKANNLGVALRALSFAGAEHFITAMVKVMADKELAPVQLASLLNKLVQAHLSAYETSFTKEDMETILNAVTAELDPGNAAVFKQQVAVALSLPIYPR